MVTGDTHTRGATVLGVVPNSGTLQQCSIAILDVAGDQVTVQYGGLSGNQPATFANFVGIWQGSIIPFGSVPLARAPITLDQETGSVVVDVTITASSYTAAYSLGDVPTNLCAAQRIDAAGQLGPPDAVTIALNNIGPTSLSLTYETLPGYRPSSAGNWVGLWKGEIDPYDPGAAVATVPIKSDANADNVAIVTPIAIKTTYTLVYFVGPSHNTAAATLTFSTST